MTEPLAPHLSNPIQLGEEISITGKWVPSKKGGIFRKSEESREMLNEWEDIHLGARNHEGVLSTEINHAVGQDAVLVHHVFKNEQSLGEYFSTTATEHMVALTNVAIPELHLVRGVQLSQEVIESISSKSVPAAFGEHKFSYVKEDYKQPDTSTAIQVTAKWTCKSDDPGQLEELIYWWQRVGTDAYDLEKGLLRFEVYRSKDENALIIHETFNNTKELQYHLSKGTAEKYKKDIDKIASPECYYFRGPVSWTIRTYSKFLGLPATYSSRGSHFTSPGGSMSDGLI